MEYYIYGYLGMLDNKNPGKIFVFKSPFKILKEEF